MTAPISGAAVHEEILYPDDDGLPMADNTLQYQWIVTIQGNLDALFRRDDKVFVAGNLLWYPVHKKPKVRMAPDILVAFGRPKGYRGSYKQWEEGGIPPQVVFEILSPKNRPEEMDRKFDFYDLYDVEEYYVYDPYSADLEGYQRAKGELQPIEELDGWFSPRLGIRFDLTGNELVILRPDGQRFLTFVELATEQEKDQERAKKAQNDAMQAQERAKKAQDDAMQAQERAKQAQEHAKQAQEHAKQAQEHADRERLQREEAQAKAARLAARLRELGVDPGS
jgi:Uma2 family endonuclease